MSDAWSLARVTRSLPSRSRDRQTRTIVHKVAVRAANAFSLNRLRSRSLSRQHYSLAFAQLFAEVHVGMDIPRTLTNSYKCRDECIQLILCVLHSSGNWKLIGASLSEPHTSVTALRTCVCMLVCWFGLTTYRKL